MSSSKQNQPLNILINRTDAIGDTLLTLPICESLKKEFPNAKIVYLAGHRCEGLFDYIGSQDETWFLNRKLSKWKQFFYLFSKMRLFQADVFIHLGGSSLPVILSFLLGIKKRLGLVSKVASVLCLNMGTRQKRTDDGRHEVELNLDVLKPLGINENQAQRPIVREDSIAGDSLKDFLAQSYSEDRKNIFIHPGMTGHTLNWPVKNYASLVRKLEDQYPSKFRFLLSFTPSDMKYVNQFKFFIKEMGLDNIILFDGAERGLKHYIECVSRADLFIGPSTGTTHIANILEVPVLTFYSPIKAQHSNRWRPYFGKESELKVIEPLISCPERLECRGQACEHYFCMEQLTVQDAVAAAEALLDIKN